MRRSRRAALFLIAAMMAAACGAARADVFLLHNGGQVQGEWLNRSQPSAKAYVIQSSSGRLSLAKDRVAEVVLEQPAVREYARIAPGFPDTVGDQWQIAEWCRERNLKQERALHLRRIIELEPDHVPARLGLGYMHQGGRWVTREQKLQEQGYEFYQGRWRIVQEIELLEQRQKRDQAENEWRGRLHRLREALARDSSGKTYQKIAELRDPRAAPAVAELLAKERRRPVRLLYVEVLGGIASSEALQILVASSVNDRDEEVRFASLEQIRRLRPPGIAGSYIGMLRGNDNMRINRAAFALGELGERTAIEPLIEALVTIHEQKVRIGGSSDAVSTTFSKDSLGGGGASFTSGGTTEVVRVAVQNPAVLTALVRLTRGPSFEYNQYAWRNWYSLEKSRLEAIDARRDANP
jgi:hypothetical protein